MKVYGLATALSQTDKEKQQNKFSLMKTTVVYDSASRTIEALHSPDKEEFGVQSKPGIKVMAESLLKTVREVVELQNAANAEFNTDIKAPVIFGAAEDFHQGNLGSVVEMIPKTKSDASYRSQSHSIVKYANKMLEFLKDNGVPKTSYKPFRRTAVLYKENLDSGYTQEELESVKPTEHLPDNRIDDLARGMANRVADLHLNYGGATSVTSLIQIALPKKPANGAQASEFEKNQQFLSDLKALEFSRENKRKFGIAFMKYMSEFGLPDQLKQAITIKTPFVPGSRQFYDVVSTEMATIAALNDPSLKGTMVNDFVYVPEAVAQI